MNRVVVLDAQTAGHWEWWMGPAFCALLIGAYQGMKWFLRRPRGRK